MELPSVKQAEIFAIELTAKQVSMTGHGIQSINDSRCIWFLAGSSRL